MSPIPNDGYGDFVLTISDDEVVPDLDLRPSKKRKISRSQGQDAALQYDEPELSDGDFDTAFEFDLGDEGLVTDGLIGGWDLPVSAEAKKFQSVAVDTDDIILQRRVRGIPRGDEEFASSQGSFDVAQKDEQDTHLDAVGSDSDEGLNAAFGMAAPQDASDEEPFNHDNNYEVDGNENEDNEDEDELAAPVSHPYDDISEDEGLREDEQDMQTQRQKAFFAPDDSKDTIFTSNATFQSMSLSRPILKGLNAVGFTTPTPIQLKTVPVALLGKDIVGGAVTGSGKTAAFVIPILERLLFRPKTVPTTRVAILMPTRELAVQCYNVTTKLAMFTDITVTLLVGGLSVREQEQALKKRPDIVIATPGRFIDHMRNSASFAVENIEIVVLDEADRMLEDGFADELNEILATIPKSRQTMLFSATMTQNVDKLVRAGLHRPVRLMVDAKRQTVQGLVQEFIKFKGAHDDVNDKRRMAYLLHLCTEVYTTKTIVFFPRKDLVHRAKVLFALCGIKAAELHGGMSQEQRLAAVSSFRDGQKTHLLATDLASRGLDIPHTDTVVNFTVPSHADTYLHRVGRTARAGRSGIASTIFLSTRVGTKPQSGNSTSERTLIRPILRLARSQNAIIRTRALPLVAIENLITKISSLQAEIDAVLLEEKEQKLLQQTERDLIKGENLVKYEDEIASRPKRTWFQSTKEKQASSQFGKSYQNEEQHDRPRSLMKKAKGKKLSGKDRKRLLNKDDRQSGKLLRKKGREEREGRGVLKQSQKGKQKKREKKSKAN